MRVGDTDGGDKQVWRAATRSSHQGREPLAQLEAHVASQHALPHKGEPGALRPRDAIVENAGPVAALRLCPIGAHALPPQRAARVVVAVCVLRTWLGLGLGLVLGVTSVRVGIRV